MIKKRKNPFNLHAVYVIIISIFKNPYKRKERIMKKLLVLLIVLVTLVTGCFALVACSSNADYVIGIVQFAPHNALDAANDAFQSRLEELCKENGKTVDFVYNNAQGKQDFAITAADTLVNRSVDMIFAIATPAAQQVASATTEIPIVFTAVTSAEIAGLTASNITGATDLNDVELQVELMTQLCPDADKFGILYSTDEPNSQLQKDLAVEAMKAKGFADADIVVYGINTVDMVENCFNNFKNKGVDCIYIPTDNRLAEAASSVHEFNKSSGANIPIVCGETGMNGECGVATYGVNYSSLGVKAAEIAFDILYNGKKPSEIPVVDPEITVNDFALNEAIANEIGFTIPDTVKNIGK